MKMTDNTILITGGGSGIGRALAEMFHGKGNTVIIAGRSADKLDEVTLENDGMQSVVLDITSPESVRSVVADVENRFPGLNVVIHNAGMMKPETIGDGDVETAIDTIETNLIGQIRLNSALVPLLKKAKGATILTVSSGLAFLPRADFPTYCASKAAIHSYTQSLRSQLEADGVQVIELVPPYTQTELQGPDQASDPLAMPLADFIAQTTAQLESDADITEVDVDRVLFQRTAESSGEYDERYAQFQARFH